MRLAIHAGAGPIRRATGDAAQEAEQRRALAAVLEAGRAALARGAAALDVVELAVRRLEDAELWNAGRGAVLNAAGGVELDAAVMDGRGRRAGAVAAVRGLRNPVSAARAVLEHTSHVLLAGPGAEAFCRARGLAFEPAAYFVTEARRAQLERVRARGGAALDHDAAEDARGTVGAVARDRDGHLAAATSTGGMVNKLEGRVGDSPIFGAGTWADDATCAVSGTGHGEIFVRAAFAHEIDALIRHRGATLDEACAAALARVAALGGAGGCAAVDAAGRVALPFNTAGMYRGWTDAEGPPRVAIFADEDPGPG